MTKYCRCCGNTKEITEFNFKGDKRYPHIKKGKCKTCERKKPSQLKAKARYVVAKRKAVELLGGKCMNPSCPLTPGKYPSCIYDFHHRDPTQKKFSISRMSCRTWTTLKAELDKCDLLCCICHRILHDNLNIDKV